MHLVLVLTDLQVYLLMEKGPQIGKRKTWKHSPFSYKTRLRKSTYVAFFFFKHNSSIELYFIKGDKDIAEALMGEPDPQKRWRPGEQSLSALHGTQA